MRINVAGGTNAGHRIVIARPPWRCACGITYSGERYSCGACEVRNPGFGRVRR